MLMNEKFLETKGINSIKFIWLNFKFEPKPRHMRTKFSEISMEIQI